ncbi:hypothetical protein MASR1M66_12940 [Aminivibrio sp.]
MLALLVAMMFADMGADVIKIERPDGETTLRMPSLSEGEALHEPQLGKKSVTLESEGPQGKRDTEELAKKSDAFIENSKLRHYG